MLVAGYVVALGVYLLSVWESVVGFGAAGAYLASRMADVGHKLMSHVGWFQYLVVQGVAVVLLSTSIRREVRTGSLQLLLATPVTGFQVVMGKLCAGLLPCAVLVAMGVPVLTLAGLFGGIAWPTVLAGAAVTLATAALAGAVTLWFSTMLQRTEAVLIACGATCLGLNLLLLAVLSLVTLSRSAFGGAPVVIVAPPAAQAAVYCVICLALMSLPVTLASRWVRSTVRGEAPTGLSADGEMGWLPPGVPAAGWAQSQEATLDQASAALARLASPAQPPPPPASAALPAWVAGLDEVPAAVGAAPGSSSAPGQRALPPPLPVLPPPLPPPVPFMPPVPLPPIPVVARPRRPEGVHWGWLASLGGVFAFQLLLIGLANTMEATGTESVLLFAHLAMAMAPVVLGVLVVVAIGRDYERQFMDVLLTTPWTGWQILWYELRRIASRGLPACLFFPVEAFLLAAVSRAGLGEVLALVLVAAGMEVLALAAGVYLAVRIRRAKVAVLWVLSVCGVAWGVAPLLVWQVGAHLEWDPATGRLSPFSLLHRAATERSSSGVASTAGPLLVLAGLHGIIGAALYWRAACRVRREAR